VHIPPDEARAGFLDDILGGDSVDVPDEGTVLDVFEQDDRPNTQGMHAKRQRIETLMRSIQHGELNDPKTQTYLDQVMDRIVAGSPFPDVRPRIHIVSSLQFRAECAPDGSIWIHLGLLRNLETEDELAFILAHEYAHMLFEHWDSEWFERTQYYSVVAGRGARELGRKAATLANKFSVQTKSFGNIGEDLDKWLLIGDLTYRFSSKVIAPAWERDQEEVADALGADLMIKAGYNPDSIVDFFSKLQAVEAEQRSAILAQRSTDAERKAHFEKALEERGLDGVVTGAIQAIFEEIGEGIEDISHSHYSAEERQRTMRRYLNREYPMVFGRETTPVPWKNRRRYIVSAWVERHLQAEEAATELDAKNGRRAAASAVKAISGVGSDLSISRFVAYSVRKAQGKSTLAVKNLEIAMKTPFPSVHVQAAYVAEALALGDWDEASRRLANADNRTGGAPDLLPLKIRIYRHFGRIEAANEALVDCLDYNVQDFQESCRIAVAESSRS
jgi:Zn-dependent protease with chaperone function